MDSETLSRTKVLAQVQVLLLNPRQRLLKPRLRLLLRHLNPQERLVVLENNSSPVLVLPMLTVPLLAVDSSLESAQAR